MRTHGTLAKWNDDRGFGFIAPAQGNEEIFVHVSAFPRDGVRPRISELISFETEAGPNGKKRAVRVMRPGQRTPPHRPRTIERADQSSGRIGTVLSLLATGAIGVYGYSYFSKSASAPSSVQTATASGEQSVTFICDGRTMCSQMTSCAEAEYFLQQCPNTKMDGNGDGEPCEQQWCN